MKLNCIDFDETLVFSTNCLYESYNESFKKILNKSFTKKEWDSWTGESFYNLLDKLDISLDDFELAHKYKNSIYPKNYLHKIKINKSLFSEISKNDINIICSQTSKNVIYKILEYNKITNWFKNIYDRDDVKNKKPAPDIYIKAITENFKSNITSINIYEDSYVGMRSAISAYENLEYLNIQKNLFSVDKYKIDIINWKSNIYAT